MTPPEESAAAASATAALVARIGSTFVGCRTSACPASAPSGTACAHVARCPTRGRSPTQLLPEGPASSKGLASEPGLPLQPGNPRGSSGRSCARGLLPLELSRPTAVGSHSMSKTTCGRPCTIQDGFRLSLKAAPQLVESLHRSLRCSFSDSRPCEGGRASELGSKLAKDLRPAAEAGPF